MEETNCFVEDADGYRTIIDPVHQKTFESKEALQLMGYTYGEDGWFVSEKALEKGTIIREINVYGLLVSHSSPLCMPFKCRSTCNDISQKS